MMIQIVLFFFLEDCVGVLWRTNLELMLVLVWCFVVGWGCGPAPQEPVLAPKPPAAGSTPADRRRGRSNMRSPARRFAVRPMLVLVKSLFNQCFLGKSYQTSI